MPRLMENPKVLVQLRIGFAVADEIAHEQCFLVGGVADEAGGSQKIGIEISSSAARWRRNVPLLIRIRAAWASTRSRKAGMIDRIGMMIA